MTGLPDPRRLADALLAAGFTRVGGREGVYERFSWPEKARHEATLVLPLDPAAPDFEVLMRPILLMLRDMAAAGQRAADVLDALNAHTGS